MVLRKMFSTDQLCIFLFLVLANCEMKADRNATERKSFIPDDIYSMAIQMIEDGRYDLDLRYDKGPDYQPNNVSQRVRKVRVRQPIFEHPGDADAEREKHLYIWPEAIIPVDIDPSFSKNMLTLIAVNAILFERNTCLKFYKYDPDIDFKFLAIINDDAPCSGEVGMHRNPVLLNLYEPRCYTSHIIAHEMMHTLGFGHEHQRVDRDDYIDIFPNNIYESARHHEFDIGIDSTNFYTYMPYNTKSIMHYASDQFSLGGYTLLALKEPMVIEKNTVISQFDYNNINRHYKCGETHPDCKDKQSKRYCDVYGLGLVPNQSPPDDYRARPLMYAKNANCKDTVFAEHNCIKMCGQCHKFTRKILPPKQITYGPNSTYMMGQCRKITFH